MKQQKILSFTFAILLVITLYSFTNTSNFNVTTDESKAINLIKSLEGTKFCETSNTGFDGMVHTSQVRLLSNGCYDFYASSSGYPNSANWDGECMNESQARQSCKTWNAPVLTDE